MAITGWGQWRAFLGGLMLWAGLAAIAVGQEVPPDQTDAASGSSQQNEKPSKAGKAVVPKEPLPELVSDRPDFTESTVVVRPGVIQTEMGVTLGAEGGRAQLSTGEILIRLGVTKRLELRFGGEGLLAEITSSNRWQRGISDAEIGLKIGVWEQRQYRPALSLIPILSLPTGATAFSSGGYEPTVKIALDKDLIAGFTVGANINFSSLRTDTGRFIQRGYSLSLGHDLVAGFGGYWEVYRFAPWEDGSTGAWIANTGLTHAVGRNAQLDVRVGKRMSGVGPDWFAGVGFVFRQPTRLFVH